MQAWVTVLGASVHFAVQARETAPPAAHMAGEPVTDRRQALCHWRRARPQPPWKHKSCLAALSRRSAAHPVQLADKMRDERSGNM
jgi:hypothetical protein